MVTWHRPFCLELRERTYALLRMFLERFCDTFHASDAPSPFKTPDEHTLFVTLCLKLLANHLSMSLGGGLAASVLGQQAAPLRVLLFR